MKGETMKNPAGYETTLEPSGHDCPWCDGKGKVPDVWTPANRLVDCVRCHGTGKHLKRKQPKPYGRHPSPMTYIRRT